MKVVKKAYRVWVHSQIGEYPVFSVDDLDVVYAQNISEAKRKCECWSEGKNEDGDDARFIDIKCRRVPEMDKVEYNGQEMTKYEYKKSLEREERKNRLRKLDESDFYYVQDSRQYVGNSVLWWGNGGGYTTDISKAEKLSKEEVLKRFLNSRGSDVIWSAKHVDCHIKQHVDSQYLQREFCV